MTNTQKITLEEYFQPILNEIKEIRLKAAGIREKTWKTIRQFELEIEGFKKRGD